MTQPNSPPEDRTPNPAATRAQPFGRRRSRLKWVLLAAAGSVALLCTALILGRNVWITPRLAALIQEAVRKETGLEVTVGGIGGSLLADIEITDVRTVKTDGSSALSALALKRLSARYSLVSAFKGLAGFLAETTLAVDGLELDIDLARPGEDPAAGVEPASSSPFPILLPTVRLRDAAIRVRGEGFQTALAGLRLEADPEPGGPTRVRLGVDRLSWSHPGLRPGSAALAATGTLSPERIRLESLLVDGKPFVTRAELGLPNGPRPTPFAADLSLAGGSAAFDGTLSNSTLALRLKAGRVDLGRLSSIFDLEGMTLAGTLALDADLTLPLESFEAASGRLDLTLAEAVVRGVGVARVDLKSSLAAGLLRVDALAVESGKSRLVVSGAEAPLGRVIDGHPMPLLKRLSGQLELVSEDVPALLALAGLGVETPPGAMPEHQLALEARLDAGRVSVARTRLTSDKNRILVRSLNTSLQQDMGAAPLEADLEFELPELGRLVPLLGLPPLAGSLRGELKVGGTVANPAGSARISAENLSIDKLPLGRLSVQATAERQEIRIESATLSHGPDRVAAKGVVRPAEGRIEAAEIDFSLADIGPLARLLLPESWSVAGALHGKAAASGPWGTPDARLDFDFKQLHIRGVAFGAGSGILDWRAGRLKAAPFTVSNGKDRLQLEGSYDFTGNEFGETRLALDTADLGRYMDAFLPDRDWSAGAVEATLEGSGPLKTPEFTLDLAANRARAAGIDFGEARLKAAGAGRRVRIDTLAAKTRLADLSLSGTLERGPTDESVGLALESLRLERPDAAFVLEREARVRLSPPGVVTVDGFELGGVHGKVRVQGVLATAAASDITVRLEKLRGGDWLPALTGRPVAMEGLDATLRAHGPPGRLAFSLDGEVERLAAIGGPISYAGRFGLALSGGTLSIRELVMTGPGSQRIEIAGALPVDTTGGLAPGPGTLALDAKARLPELEFMRTLVPSWPLAAGGVEAEFSLAGTWRRPEGTLRLDGSGLVPDRGSVPLPPGPFTAALDARLEQNRLILRRLAVNGPQAELEGAGSWEDLPDLLQLAGGGNPPGAGRLAFHSELKIADLGWLGRGLKDVRRTAGALEVSATLAGPADDPQIKAELRLSGGELRPESSLPPITALALQARTDGRRVEIPSLGGELGGAPFQLKGAVEGVRALETEGRVDLGLSGDNLLLYRSDETILRADTRLKLSGPLTGLRLAGEVALTDGRLSKNLGLMDTLLTPDKPGGGEGLRLFSIDSPPWRDMRFDIRVTSRRPFQIRSNVARGELRPDLVLSGTGQLPSLSGVVYVEPSRLILPAGRIEIESGLVRFLTSDPDRPVLDLNGRSQLYGYDITVLIEGPYDAPEITLSSVPPLPREDLLFMLLTGQPPRHSAGQNGGERAGMKVAVFVGRDFITRWLQGDGPESEESILERFDVEVGRALTQAGDETIDASFRLVDGFVRRGGTLYLTGEKDIYDYYNAGVRLVFRFK